MSWLVNPDSWMTHPFHAVAGSDLAELLVVGEERNVYRVGEFRVICRTTKVQFALRFGKRVQAGGRARRSCRGSCRAASGGRSALPLQ